jgi:hypothetical protein
MIPHCAQGMSRLFESTCKKVDSVGTTGFSPNYFEYRLFLTQAYLEICTELNIPLAQPCSKRGRMHSVMKPEGECLTCPEYHYVPPGQGHTGHAL